MRIAILTQFYPPEMEPSGIMFRSLAEYLAKKGNQVSVISGFPNFPTGKFLNKRKYEIYRETVVNGIHLKNVWIIPSDNISIVRRILNYLSFMLSAIILSLKGGKNYDIIIATSPPLLAGLAGVLFSKIINKPLVLDIRDVWPESAIQLGLLKNKSLIRITEYIEKLCYIHHLLLHA